MKDQTLSIFPAFRLGPVALALLAFVLVGLSRGGSAQTGSATPAPTHDYNDTVAGIQAPTSPLLAGAENRYLQSVVVDVPVLVSLTELQSALPPGFIAPASPPGSNTGRLVVTFIFQQRSTRIADGRTFGGSGLLFQTTVMNSNLVPTRQEVGFLSRELSSQEFVDYYNSAYGAGAARLAKINMQVTEDGGILSFNGTVIDDGLGLNVSVRATSSGPLVNRFKADPGPISRFLIPQRALFTAIQGDGLSVPQAMANVQFDATGGKLQVPVADGGSRSLTISGIGANITFQRNLEYFTKNE